MSGDKRSGDIELGEGSGGSRRSSGNSGRRFSGRNDGWSDRNDSEYARSQDIRTSSEANSFKTSFRSTWQAEMQAVMTSLKNTAGNYESEVKDLAAENIDTRQLKAGLASMKKTLKLASEKLEPMSTQAKNVMELYSTATNTRDYYEQHNDSDFSSVDHEASSEIPPVENNQQYLDYCQQAKNCAKQARDAWNLRRSEARLDKNVELITNTLTQADKAWRYYDKAMTYQLDQASSVLEDFNGPLKLKQEELQERKKAQTVDNNPADTKRSTSSKSWFGNFGRSKDS